MQAAYEHQFQSGLPDLRSYKLNQRKPDLEFDRLTYRLARTCDCNYAALTLIYNHQHCFKSVYGGKPLEIKRAFGVCTKTLIGNNLIEIKDTEHHPLLAEEPLIIELGIRFYAAMPLLSPHGHAIGTLAVMHNEPSKLNLIQKISIQTLALEATYLIEQREKVNGQSNIWAVGD